MEITTITAPSHQSHLIRRPFQHHPWMSVHLTVRKHRTLQLTTTPSIRRTSHDVYTGPLHWSTLKTCSSLFRLTVLTSFNGLTIRTQLDFKSEYLFRICSVVTNLVTSIEFQPIRCATTLFHFGRTRNVYVATRISLLSGTAESSATSDYVVPPERCGQNDAWAGRNVQRAKKKPTLFPTVDLTDAACTHKTF